MSGGKGAFHGAASLGNHSQNAHIIDHSVGNERRIHEMMHIFDHHGAFIELRSPVIIRHSISEIK
jgi:hypothetical protein